MAMKIIVWVWKSIVWVWKSIVWVFRTFQQAFAPRWPTQEEIVRAVRFIVDIVLFVAIVVAILVWASNSGFVTQNNAAVVGALLALAGVLIAQIVNASLARSAQRHQQQLEDRRVREQQELENQRARAAALQAYLDQMGNLLIHKNLQESKPYDSVRTVAQAQTLSILEWSDPIRKGILLQFLYRSNLILKDNPTISLIMANLQGANLEGVNLQFADLKGATLKGANLLFANLEFANLEGANLKRVNLKGADLQFADLQWGDLVGADLEGANLEGAKNLSEDQIQIASGDKNTKLPGHIQRPDHWLQADKE